jgi:hypothetical protein
VLAFHLRRALFFAPPGSLWYNGVTHITLNPGLFCSSAQQAIWEVIAVAFCRTCYGETEYLPEDPKCTRCESDLRAWKDERVRASQLDYAPLIQVLLALVLILILSFILLRPVNLVRTAVAFVLGGVVALGLYAARYGLRESQWLHQIRPNPGPSLVHWVIAIIVLAIVLGVASATLNRLWSDAELSVLQKLVFYVLLSLTCASLAASLALSIVLIYLSRLDERVPQPIFTHMNRLSDLILEAAGKRLNVEAWEIRGIKRLPDGGLSIWAWLKETLLTDTNPMTVAKPVNNKARSLWLLEADRWGRIHTILPRDGASS